MPRPSILFQPRQWFNNTETVADRQRSAYWEAARRVEEEYRQECTRSLNDLLDRSLFRRPYTIPLSEKEPQEMPIIFSGYDEHALPGAEAVAHKGDVPSRPFLVRSFYSPCEIRDYQNKRTMLDASPGRPAHLFAPSHALTVRDTGLRASRPVGFRLTRESRYGDQQTFFFLPWHNLEPGFRRITTMRQVPSQAWFTDPTCNEKNPDGFVWIYANPLHMMLNRRTAMKPGRFASQFGLMAPDYTALDTAVSIVEFHITQDPQVIRYIYEHGPPSCMAHGPTRDKHHPAEVYGTKELGVAYLAGKEITPTVMKEKSLRVSARSVVHIPEKVYVRAYGDTARLDRALRVAGFQSRGDSTKDVFSGLRIPKIAATERGTFFLPYFDMASYVYDPGGDSPDFVLFRDGGAAGAHGVKDLSSHYITAGDTGAVKIALVCDKCGRVVVNPTSVARKLYCYEHAQEARKVEAKRAAAARAKEAEKAKWLDEAAASLGNTSPFATSRVNNGDIVITFGTTTLRR